MCCNCLFDVFIIALYMCLLVYLERLILYKLEKKKNRSSEYPDESETEKLYLYVSQDYMTQITLYRVEFRCLSFCKHWIYLFVARVK